MKDTIWSQLALWGPPQKPDNWSWKEVERRRAKGDTSTRKPKREKPSRIPARVMAMSLDSLLG